MENKCKTALYNNSKLQFLSCEYGCLYHVMAACIMCTQLVIGLLEWPPLAWLNEPWAIGYERFKYGELSFKLHTSMPQEIQSSELGHAALIDPGGLQIEW